MGMVGAKELDINALFDWIGARWQRWTRIKPASTWHELKTTKRDALTFSQRVDFQKEFLSSANGFRVGEK